ncbi:hypothetical protein CP061683_1016B, partial [Chlamydia psittaci 06-1683]
VNLVYSFYRDNSKSIIYLRIIHKNIANFASFFRCELFAIVHSGKHLASRKNTSCCNHRPS